MFCFVFMLVGEALEDEDFEEEEEEDGEEGEEEEDDDPDFDPKKVKGGANQQDCKQQ